MLHKFTDTYNICTHIGIAFCFSTLPYLFTRMHLTSQYVHKRETSIFQHCGAITSQKTCTVWSPELPLRTIQHRNTDCTLKFQIHTYFHTTLAQSKLITVRNCNLSQSWNVCWSVKPLAIRTSLQTSTQMCHQLIKILYTYLLHPVHT